MVKPFTGTLPPAVDKALFGARLTGCLVTQIPAFSKRMDLPVERVRVGRRDLGGRDKAGRVCETAPKGFKIDIHLDAPVSRGCSMTANLTPTEIAWRAAQDIEGGAYANLCIGFPETVAKIQPPRTAGDFPHKERHPRLWWGPRIGT